MQGKMFAPACLHVTGIPGVKCFLCIGAEPERRTRLDGSLIEVVNNPFHTFGGGFVRPAID